MQPRSLAIFLAPPVRTRSKDVEYPFRQSSDLYYLTGFSEPDCALVLTPRHTRLYLRKRDPEMEIWTGERLGTKRAPNALGLDEALPFERFFSDLPQLLKNRSALYYEAGLHADYDRRLLAIAHASFARARGGSFGPSAILQPGSLLWEMRLKKTPEEIALLRRSAEITKEAHVSLMKEARPGMFAYELHATIQRCLKQSRATEAYPSIVAPGRHACILHYTENSARLGKSDLVLVDAGAELDCMATDVTRTFPAARRFFGAQRTLYEVVLEAQKAAIRKCRPKSTLEEIHEAALIVLIQGLVDLKLLSGRPNDLLAKEKERRNKELQEQKKLIKKEMLPSSRAPNKRPARKKTQKKKRPDNSYLTYYMHKTSHWLGMDVHDVGAYYDESLKPRRLEAGMVLTVEPGLYIPIDDPKAPKELRGTGIRIEDDILITKNSRENLTQGTPKSIEEIEELRKAAFA